MSNKYKIAIKNLKGRNQFGDLCIQAIDDRMLLTVIFKAL